MASVYTVEGDTNAAGIRLSEVDRIRQRRVEQADANREPTPQFAPIKDTRQSPETIARIREARCKARNGVGSPETIARMQRVERLQRELSAAEAAEALRPSDVIRRELAAARAEL